MILFVIYGVLIWYLALRWRRRWLGFASVGAGVVGIYFVARLYLWLGSLMGVSRPESFLLLMAPFGMLVGGIGLYITMLPRRCERSCRGCGYSLVGLEVRGEKVGQKVSEKVSEIAAARCPECGTRHVFSHVADETCRQCGGELAAYGHRDWVCRGCGLHHLADAWEVVNKGGSARRGAVEHTQREHERRQPQNDEKAQQQQAVGMDRSDERNGAGLRALRDQVVGEGQPVER